MTYDELLEAIENNDVLIWDDPDPIKGNDYLVTKIWDVNEETAMIHYGGGSEAGVHISELRKAKSKSYGI